VLWEAMMQTLQVEVTDELAIQIDRLLEEGWFNSREEVVRLALREYLDRQRFELTERYQREDIAWALRQKQSAR
jgi:Arc/MetJ-type ribon-helix-helix transcriptional regulator